jgi:hypothetical protein
MAVTPAMLKEDLTTDCPNLRRTSCPDQTFTSKTGRVCVELSSDSANCGACGVHCVDGE